MTQKKCPFKEGDWVIYKPSTQGIDLDVMSSESEKLIPGRIYKVIKIQDESYVVVEGYSHPGGGLYWTEFDFATPPAH